jgi:periplasmic protein TonB
MNQPAFASASPLHYNTAPKKLRPSVVVGLAIALGLHLLLIVYLIGQTITTVAVPVETPEPPFIGGIVSLSKPETPKPTIDVHKPENPILTATEPLPVTPPDTPQATTTSQPTASLPMQPSSEATAEGQATSTGPVAAARWSRFPGPQALSDYYPPRALEAEVEGASTLECVVRDTSGRVTCRVLSEKPGGYGFGEATRRMIEKVGRVEVTGGIVVGSILHLSVKWTLPQ